MTPPEARRRPEANRTADVVRHGGRGDGVTVGDAALFDVLQDTAGARVVASLAAYRGMHSSLDHEGQQGRAAARQRVLYVATVKETFTIDDVRAEEFVNTVSAGTWGAVFSALAREGRIRRVGVTTSKRPESHGRLVRVWTDGVAAA